MSKLRIGALIVFVGITLFGVWLFTYRHHAVTVVPLTANPHVQEAYWKGRISAVGPVRAYSEFGNAVQDLTPQKQHEDAHAFGGALYQIAGVGGLSTCDARFSFGCFHEFLGRAIAALGLGSVGSLNEGCIEALGAGSLSCQHGIGHGVLAYLGYTGDDLNKALRICKDLPHNDPIGGCYGGVFMEYNLQTMLGTEGRIRPPTSDMQAPCDSVADAYKTACYFWQPQWWRQNFFVAGMTDDDRAYAAAGVLCAQVPAPYTRTCFEGIGNIAPSDAHFDGARTRTLCEDASSDPTDRLYCKSLAADSLFVGADAKEDATAVCADLPADQYRYCIVYASNSANIAMPLEAPSL